MAEPVGERQLKGFSRPMPVYAATGAVDVGDPDPAFAEPAPAEAG